MTSRGMKEKDFEKICEFLDQGVQIGINAKKYSSKVSQHILLISCRDKNYWYLKMLSNVTWI